MWPRPGIAGHRPLAGDGASRRPKAVRNPRNQKNKRMIEPLEGATDAKGGIYLPPCSGGDKPLPYVFSGGFPPILSS